jgi:carbon storage regulator
VLVLTRKIGERILIGDGIVVEVAAVQGRSVRLGIEAPPGVVVLRQELVEAERVSEPGATTSC